MLDFNDDLENEELFTAPDEIGQDVGSASEYGGLAESSGGNRDVLADGSGHTTRHQELEGPNMDEVIVIETGNY